MTYERFLAELKAARAAGWQPSLDGFGEIWLLRPNESAEHGEFFTPLQLICCLVTEEVTNIFVWQRAGELLNLSPYTTFLIECAQQRCASIPRADLIEARRVRENLLDAVGLAEVDFRFRGAWTDWYVQEI